MSASARPVLARISSGTGERVDAMDARMLVLMRCLLAFSALAIIWIDPAEPTRLVELTYASLALYCVYSAGLAYASYRSGWPAPARILHWVDVVFFAALVSLTEGTSSIFFYFFFFSILVASFFAALGLRVGVVTQDLAPAQRRAAYACDITYCTNKDLAFDYLRDRVALGDARGPAHLALERLRNQGDRANRVVLRGLHFGIVDEADSVLIDEARTPLILSSSKGGEEEAKNCQQALRLARALGEGPHYTVARRDRAIDLTEAGRSQLATLCETLHGV